MLRKNSGNVIVYTYIYKRAYLYIVIVTSRTVSQHQNLSAEEVFGVQMGSPTQAEHTHSITYLSSMNVVQVENLKLLLVSYMNVLTLRQFLGCYNFHLSCEKSSALCK